MMPIPQRSFLGAFKQGRRIRDFFFAAANFLAAFYLLLPLQAGQEEKGGDHANIERFIAFQKRHSPEMKDADIGKAIILLGAPLYVCTYFKNGGQHETFDFSADDKRYYVDKFVLGNETVRQGLLKLLMDEPAREIPENAFQAYIQLGLVEKFNSMYQERLRSDRSDLHIDTDEGQLSIMLRENGCTNGAMTAYTQLDAHYGVPCVSVVLASCDGGEIFSVASALDDKDSSGIYLSTMFSRDMKSYSVGVVFADSLLRRIPHKLRLHVHVPGHGIVTFNLYNRLKSDGAKGGVDGRLFSAVRGLQGRVCIASRGKVKKLCVEANEGISADVSIRALRGSGGLESP